MNHMPMRSFSRRRLRLSALIAVVITGGLLIKFQWLDRLQAAPKKVGESAIPVVMQSATQQDLPLTLEAIGNVQPLNTVNVRVRVDGELQQVMFSEGQMVSAGSQLAQIDPRVYQAQVAQAQAVVSKDQAQVTQLRVDLNRATKLAQAKAGPSQDVDTYRAQLAAQQATLQADQAALDNARLQLSFTRITAPFTGRTGQRLLDVGSIVHGSEATGLVTLTQMDPITVAFAVSQDELGQILRENAKAPLQVAAMSRNGAQQIAVGKLSFIDSQVIAATGQIQLKAQFDNANHQLWPGQLVSARVLLYTEKAATLVPASAVQQGQNGNYVYVVNAEQHVEPRQVVAGAVVAGQQWIKQGLNPGETVVVQGQSRVAPGLKVKPVVLEGDKAQPELVLNGAQGAKG